jgi:hypothetical protein
MPCPNRSIPKDNSSPCVWYLKPGFCTRDDTFRCIEYIEQFEPEISHSEIQSFLRCRLKWWNEQVLGIEPIPENKPLPLKMGIDAHTLIVPLFDRREPEGPVVSELNREDHWELIEIIKIECLAEAIAELGLNHPQGLGEVKFKSHRDGFPTIKGRVDISEVSRGWFIELKYTTRPDDYLYPTFAKAQMAVYFLADERYEKGYMRPIRVPKLRVGNNESPEEHRSRLRDDIKSRPAFYFPNYDKEKATWGSVIYRPECDLEEELDRVRWVVRDIQRMLKEGSVYRNETSCYFPSQCEFLAACESGVISETLYRKRETRLGK